MEKGVQSGPTAQLSGVQAARSGGGYAASDQGGSVTPQSGIKSGGRAPLTPPDHENGSNPPAVHLAFGLPIELKGQSLRLPDCLLFLCVHPFNSPLSTRPSPDRNTEIHISSRKLNFIYLEPAYQIVLRG